MQNVIVKYKIHHGIFLKIKVMKKADITSSKLFSVDKVLEVGNRIFYNVDHKHIKVLHMKTNRKYKKKDRNKRIN